MTQKECTEYFKGFSDRELVRMTEELNMSTLPENSLLRKAAKAIFNNDSPMSRIGVAVPLSTELASRMEAYKETIFPDK